MTDAKLLFQQPASRVVEEYDYWRDRLIILQEVFDDSKPASLRQWWYDRRNKVQWSTFWVAVLVLFLTVLFGLIQSVVGIIQTWASIESLRRSRKGS
jgi:hypothetical protein